MVSFETVGTADDAEAVCEACRLIVHATSLGGVETSLERRARYASEREVGTPATLIRLSVGLEHVDDLWRVLSNTLSDSSGRAAHPPEVISRTGRTSGGGGRETALETLLRERHGTPMTHRLPALPRSAFGGPAANARRRQFWGDVRPVESRRTAECGERCCRESTRLEKPIRQARRTWRQAGAVGHAVSRAIRRGSAAA